jgi:hypothetical protein
MGNGLLRESQRLRAGRLRSSLEGTASRHPTAMNNYDLKTIKAVGSLLDTTFSPAAAQAFKSCWSHGLRDSTLRRLDLAWVLASVFAHGNDLEAVMAAFGYVRNFPGAFDADQLTDYVDLLDVAAGKAIGSCGDSPAILAGIAHARIYLEIPVGPICNFAMPMKYAGQHSTSAKRRSAIIAEVVKNLKLQN